MKLNKYFLFFILNISYFFFTDSRKIAKFILTNTLTKKLNTFILIIIIYSQLFSQFENYFKDNINKYKLILFFDANKKIEEINFF